MDSVNVPAKFKVRSFTRFWDNSDCSFGWGCEPQSWERRGRMGGIGEFGATEIARTDIARPSKLSIARLDNARPYRNGGHRETWQRGTRQQGSRVDITRLDIAKPYSKGGHRETWQRGTRSNRGVQFLCCMEYQAYLYELHLSVLRHLCVLRPS